MATIQISGFPESTELASTDILHISSSGLDKKISIENACKYLPVGSTVIQFPGKDSPSELGLTGTWENISSEFAGDFFRAEGGNASTFESGEQSDAMQRITGSVLRSSNTGLLLNDDGLEGAFSLGDSVSYRPDVSESTGYTLEFDSADSTSPNTAKTDDEETRAINHTIRIWERTA